MRSEMARATWEVAETARGGWAGRKGRETAVAGMWLGLGDRRPTRAGRESTIVSADGAGGYEAGWERRATVSVGRGRPRVVEADIAE